MENVCILFSAGSDNAGTKLNQGSTVKKTTLIQVVFLHSGVRRNFHTVKTQDTAITAPLQHSISDLIG